MRDLDRPQLAAVLAVLGLGLLTVFSASPGEFRRQAVWAALGLGGYAVAAAADYRRWRWLALPGYGLGLALLVLVHLHGQVELGARRWLPVAGFPLEPSEFAKPALVLALAFILSRRPRAGAAEAAAVLAAAGPALALLLLQPDLGTALVFFVVAGAMLFQAGLGWVELGVLTAAGAAALGFGMRFLHGYQRARLAVFMNPGRDPLGAGYNLLQAKIAIGSGGLWGRGYLAPGQGRLGFLPERSTDFAFAMYAEQFGLWGGLLLVCLLCLLAIRLARAAALAPDRFGYLLAGGMAAMLLAQTIENVGMNLGLTPVAGIPLPLFSYGGSALLSTLPALGLVQSVARARRPLRAASGRWALPPEPHRPTVETAPALCTIADRA